MAWDDIVFGVLTGGLYNVGKAATKAGEAADDAGAALSIVGTTVAKLGDDLDSFIKEMEKLLTIERITPRPEEDLWEEEKKRLDSLKQRLSQVQSDLNSAIESGDFFAIVSGVMKVAIVQSAINAILYQEPGVVPNTLHSVQQILERVNTMEQPRLEAILDDFHDNLQETHDILEEVKKLFVIQGWEPIPEVDLSPDILSKIHFLESEKVSAAALLTKNRAVVSKLHETLVKVNPSDFKFPTPEAVSAALADTRLASSLSEQLSSTVASGTIPKHGEGAIAHIEAAARPSPLVPHALASVAVERVASERMATLVKQPQAERVASLLKVNEQRAFLDNYARFNALASFQDRQITLIDRRIHMLRFRRVDKPGLIPQTLEAVKQTIVTLDGTIGELKNVLANVNKGMVSLGGLLSKNSMVLKIGLALFGGLIVLNMAALFILLVKLILT